MTILFYKNNSSENTVSKNIQQKLSLTGTLREDTSLLNPTLLITGVQVSTLKSINYMYIEDFGRYYYVTGVVSVGNNNWEISGRVDVLMSYGDYIRKQEGIVRRQETEYNLYLDDGQFHTYQNPIIYTKEFPQGFDGWGSSGPSYVITLAG